jgi:hypothetical protein
LVPIGNCVGITTRNTAAYKDVLTELIGPSKAITWTVQAGSNARIGLYSEKSTSEVYEIDLGVDGDTISAIRHSSQGANEVEVATPGLLSATEPRQFWADAIRGLVRVGHGRTAGENVFMQWQDPDPHVPTNVGFPTYQSTSPAANIDVQTLPPGLVGYWTLDGGGPDGTVIEDSSGNALHGRLSGLPRGINAYGLTSLRPTKCKSGCAMWDDLAGSGNTRNQSEVHAKFASGVAPHNTECLRTIDINAAEIPWCYCSDQESEWDWCTPDRSSGTLSSADFVPGLFGSAFFFSADDAIIVADSMIPGKFLDVTAVTMVAWVMPSAYDAGMCFDAAGRAHRCDRNIVMNKESVYEFGLEVDTGKLQGAFSSCFRWWGEAVIPLDAWSHVAVGQDGALERHFVNGEFAQETACEGALNINESNLMIGAREKKHGSHFRGAIDEVMLFDNCLGEAGVAALYEAFGGGATRSPVEGAAHWDVCFASDRDDVCGATYQFWRFDLDPQHDQTGLRDWPAAVAVQLSELVFVTEDGRRITSSAEAHTINTRVDGDITTPGAYALNVYTSADEHNAVTGQYGGRHPEQEHPYQAVDGNTTTKWLDFEKGDLVVNFGFPVNVHSYDWATANDSPDRDPVKWALEGSADGVTWTPVHSEYAAKPFEPISLQTSCMDLHTENSYDYNSHFHPSQLGAIKAIAFTVKASNDAHVGFFNTGPGEWSGIGHEHYEIVISGWNNTQSVIRESSQGTNYAVTDTTDILSPSEARPFWASALNGKIQLGTGHTVGDNVVMSWQDPDPIGVSFVSMTTGYGSEGDWHMCMLEAARFTFQGPFPIQGPGCVPGSSSDSAGSSVRGPPLGSSAFVFGLDEAISAARTCGLSDFGRRAAAVSAACCRGPGDCATGMPASCGFACGRIFTAFYSE